MNQRILLKTLLLTATLIFLSFFFSYRLLDVPAGLSVDEASFGKNAVYLSETGRDQNNRFLPVFVLADDKLDWRQPVTQYYITLFFKIFGPSVFNLRYTTVLITLLSIVLIYLLGKTLINKTVGIYAALIFLTTPLIMIQSHYALDNIMPIPFTIIWLLGLLLYLKKGQKKYLLLSAVSLGISFYTYKGMRGTTPVWAVITVLYLFYYLKIKLNLNWGKTIKNLSVFIFSILPFFAIIPILEHFYANAVFDRQNPTFNNLYDFLYPYISIYDFGFLFIKGDDTLFHSTQKHGMMLLATMPLFLVGCYQSLKKRDFWFLIIAAFFTAPLLFGLVNSVHRASRVMSIIPSYSLICALGGIWLWAECKNKGKIILVCIGLLMTVNYFDFLNYYWFSYPKITESLFGSLQYYKSYEKASKIAQEKNLTIYTHSEFKGSTGQSGEFFEAIYFPSPIKTIDSVDSLPKDGLFFTFRGEVPNLKRVDVNLPYFYLHQKD